MAFTKEETDDMKAHIVNEIAEGRSLKNILENDFGMPGRQLVYEWLNENTHKHDAVFAEKYARARNDSADLDVERMEELNQELRENKIHPAAARIIADNLKWTAGRKKPRKYGNNIDITSGHEKIQQSVVVLPANDRNGEKSNDDLM